MLLCVVRILMKQMLFTFETFFFNFFQVQKTKQEVKSVIGAAQTPKDQVATVVLVLSTIFVICNSAESIYYILRYFGASINCHNFTFLAITFNASVNALVYGIFSQKFRKIFINLICPSCNDGLTTKSSVRITEPTSRFYDIEILSNL